MMRNCFLLGVAGLLGLLALPAHAGQVAGRLSFTDKDGKAAPDAADARYAVVYFEPAAGGRPGAPRAAEMATRGKQFEPLVLAVPRGSSVRFPNFDPILHNVFSVSGENRFDLGLYAKGTGKSWTFKKSGVVRVFCNVHHSMVGYVLVLDTAFFANVGKDGSFVLTGLPDGPGKLTVWHPQIDPWVRDLTVGASTAPLAVAVTAVRERVPSHNNKAGRPYSRNRRDQYNG